MTICVPKRPFEIGWKLFIHSVRLSWIPITALLIYQSNLQDTWGLMILMIPLCFLQMLWTIIWAHDLNEENEWIQWCQNNPVNISSKESTK